MFKEKNSFGRCHSLYKNKMFRSQWVVETVNDYWIMCKPRTRRTKMYHVVARRYNGKLVTYEIWKNNKRCLIPTNKFKLGRRAAYDIVRYLNP